VKTHARIDYEACPLCGGESGDELGTASVTKHPLFKAGLPETLRWLRCGGCGHVFASGYFGPEALSLLFSSANPSQLPGVGDVDRGRQVSARIVERVVTARAGALGRWLDVGFGNGALVTTAAEFGFHAVGLDVREAAVQRLNEFGYEAHAGSLDDFHPEARFDVVSLADVLEHLTFPKQALEQVAALLAPGGCVFISTPNLDSFHWKAMDRAGKNPYWAELEHLHVFGRERLYELLRELGFEPLRYSVSERYLAGMEVLARRA
jgi:SAM-dependent methyltransferase